MPAKNTVDTARLRHYVAQGMTARAIAVRAGVSRGAVYKAAKMAGMRFGEATSKEK